MNVVLLHGYISARTTAMLSEPLGLICLASYVESRDSKRDFNISIVDLFALGYDIKTKNGDTCTCGISDRKTIIGLLEAKAPDVIGIPCSFTTLTRGAFELINTVKAAFPKCTVIVGGPHATMDPEGVLSKTTADMVVCGEGEETLWETLCALRDRAPVSGILGLVWRGADGKVTVNPRRPLIDDLDTLPNPNRKFIDQDCYTSEINRRLYSISKGNRTASIITSRGCPYNCIFCSTKVVWERRFRPRSPELVVAEIDQLVNDYGIDEIRINDDQFFGDIARAHAIADLLLTRKYKVNIYVLGGSSVWLVNDEKLLRKMKKAGMYRMLMPIETGSENTKKYIRKNIDFEGTARLTKLANRLGIWTYAVFVLGFPYEKREDIEKTVAFACSLGLDNATFFIAKAYAGSEMCEDFRKEGLLVGEDFSDTGEASCDTLYIKKEEFHQILKDAERRVQRSVILNYLNPVFFARYVLPKINSVDGFAYLCRYVYRIFTMQILARLFKRYQ